MIQLVNTSSLSLQPTRPTELIAFPVLPPALSAELQLVSVLQQLHMGGCLGQLGDWGCWLGLMLIWAYYAVCWVDR